MKNLIYPLATSVLVCSIGFGTYFISKETQKATTAATNAVESLNQKFLSETPLEYKSVSTNSFTQTTSFTNLTVDFSSIGIGKLSIGSLSISRNFWNQNDTGNTEKAFLSIKDINLVQELEENELSVFEDIGMSGLLKRGLTTHYDEISCSFEGLLPNNFDDLTAAVLTILGSDQKAVFTIKNATYDFGSTDIPFFKLLSDKQWRDLNSVSEEIVNVSYSTSSNKFSLNTSKYLNNFFNGTANLFAEIDAKEAIADKDYRKIKLGAISAKYDVHSKNKLSELQFGDGVNMGKHSLGGLNANMAFDADLAGATLDSLVTQPMLTLLPILNKIKLSYGFGFNNLSVNLNTSDSVETQLGSYELGDATFQFDVNGESVMQAQQNPLAAIQASSAKFSIKGLNASPTTQLSSQLVFMGLAPEAASAPTINELTLDIKADENGLLNLKPNKFLSNFGSLTLDGSIDINTLNLNDVEIKMADFPSILLEQMMVSLPPEAYNAMVEENGTYTLKIKGNILSGPEFE